MLMSTIFFFPSSSLFQRCQKKQTIGCVYGIKIYTIVLKVEDKLYVILNYIAKDVCCIFFACWDDLCCHIIDFTYMNRNSPFPGSAPYVVWRQITLLTKTYNIERKNTTSLIHFTDDTWQFSEMKWNANNLIYKYYSWNVIAETCSFIWIHTYHIPSSDTSIGKVEMEHTSSPQSMSI